jgi:4'-phosphopantetheinyl transferase EntD
VVRIADHLARIVPTASVVAELIGYGDPAVLTAEEAVYVSRAVLKRRSEFAAGRVCARKALSALGIFPTSICVGERGSPKWPFGIAGSITHTGGFTAAVVVKQADVESIGIDSEIVGSIEHMLWPMICADDEYDWLMQIPSATQAAAVSLLFSAKEAVYKWQFPIARAWLDFQDLKIDVPNWGMQESTFSVRFCHHEQWAARVGSTSDLACRFRFHDQYVTTSVWRRNRKP